MKFMADLHIHSRFSRATSRDLTPETLSLWARKKGITVIGAGDCTHPTWVAELGEKLVEAEDGLYRLRPDLQQAVDAQVPDSCRGETRFLFSGEISCIYKKDGKTRKVHHLILMPDMASVTKLNRRLDRIGNITSDGRPILGLDSKALLELTLEASDRAFFIPAHVWTPWFSVFGSKSGFDSLEECFEDLTGHIHALETGLSSDPSMNRRLSALDPYVLVSNSDAHSPAKLGREANLFDTELNYHAMTRAMTDGKGFSGTIEFYPEEGKYHLDGHRNCRVRFEPAETIAHAGLCPVCGKSLTVGVLSRVHALSDRHTPAVSKPFFSLVPLPEILSQLFGCGPATKKVDEAYERLLADLGPELRILKDVSLGDIEAAGGPLLKEAIDRMRHDQVIRLGGYDGEFGVIRMFEDDEIQALAGQLSLFAQPEKPQPKPAGKSSTRKKTLVERKTKAVTQAPAVVDDPILGPLNPEQRAAVLHLAGHLMVVAGPGTGKTMTLTHRIAQLIREGIAAPEEILALTFTRKAAQEMAQRISSLVQCLKPGRLRVSTFHGFCLEIIRGFGSRAGLTDNFALCSERDSEQLARECAVDSTGGKGLLQTFLKTLPEMKTLAVLRAAGKDFSPELWGLFHQYQFRLRSMGMLDLDDLEIEGLRLISEHSDLARHYAERFPWIFVDEYQDTNPAQAALLKCIVQAGPVRICAIGDPDQAIYGFRGADVTLFHRFMLDFPGASQITLDKNYRSTDSILKGATAVLGNKRPLQGSCATDGPIYMASSPTDGQEAEMIVEQVERLLGGVSHFSMDSGRVSSHDGDESFGLGDIGVLYRLNVQGDALEKALNRAGLPIIRSGETPLASRYPVNLLHRYLQTCQFPHNPIYAAGYETLLKEHQVEPMGDAPAVSDLLSVSDRIDRAAACHNLDVSSEEISRALNRLQQLAERFENDMSAFLDALSLERGLDHGVLTGDRIALMSFHAAKGLEWPVVFLTGCEDKLLPCSLFGDVDEEEERRLFYVGMTRARKRLIISHVARRSLSSRILEMRPSPFLDRIGDGLCKRLDRGSWRPRKRPQLQLSLFEKVWKSP
jgi:DNA helicase II / ATP-dependent DNA helicase PcrA